MSAMLSRPAAAEVVIAPDARNGATPRSPPSAQQQNHKPPPPRQFLRPLEGKLKCGACGELLRDPVQNTSCGHRFCAVPCAHCIITGGKRCPIDGKPMETQQVFKDKSAELETSQIIVYCKYKEYGCQETRTLLLITAHEEECSFGRVECPNKCQSKVRRSELQTHFPACVQSSLLVMDPYSTEEFGPQDIRRLLLAMSMIMKENEELKKMMQGSQLLLARHSDQLNALKDAVGEPTGTGHSAREASIETRLTAITETISSMGVDARSSKSPRRAADAQQLEVTVADMDLRLESVEHVSYSGTILWKVAGYTRLKREACDGRRLSIYSPVFYTSRYGYRLRARAYLNGDGYGKNKYLSLFLVLCKGEHDALLRWPFAQRVTFALLDQTARGGHHSDSFFPDVTSASFQKPTSEQNVASGCPQFASHEMIERPSNGSRYLVDDAIFIKVDIDTHSLRRVEDVGSLRPRTSGYDSY